MQSNAQPEHKNPTRRAGTVERNESYPEKRLASNADRNNHLTLGRLTSVRSPRVLRICKLGQSRIPTAGQITPLPAGRKQLPQGLYAVKQSLPGIRRHNQVRFIREQQVAIFADT